MKQITLFITILFIAFIVASCGNKKEKTIEKELETLAEEIEKIPESKASGAKIYGIKSGYVKYKNIAAGMEMTRELWFDNYGALQYEENYMDMMGQKVGGSSLVNDGFKYNWDYNSQTGNKMKFYSAPMTDFSKVRKEDIERYKMKDLGFETIAGKSCQKVSVEKPVEAVTWTWEGIPMKTLSKFGGNEVSMEVLELKEENVPASKFVIPEGITFNEM
jgi:hypothetical protein